MYSKLEKPEGDRPAADWKTRCTANERAPTTRSNETADSWKWSELVTSVNQTLLRAANPQFNTRTTVFCVALFIVTKEIHIALHFLVKLARSMQKKTCTFAVTNDVTDNPLSLCETTLNFFNCVHRS